MSVQDGYQVRARVASPPGNPLWAQPVATALGLFVIAALIVAIGLALPNVLTVGFDFEKNYNEGWNVYNTQRLLNHEVIYDSNYWRINNYPILSFLIIAQVSQVTHDLLLAGRLVGLLAFAAIGVLAAVAIRPFGGDRLGAIFGGGCALGFYFLV